MSTCPNSDMQMSTASLIDSELVTSQRASTCGRPRRSSRLMIRSGRSIHNTTTAAPSSASRSAIAPPIPRSLTPVMTATFPFSRFDTSHPHRKRSSPERSYPRSRWPGNTKTGPSWGRGVTTESELSACDDTGKTPREVAHSADFGILTGEMEKIKRRLARIPRSGLEPRVRTGLPSVSHHGLPPL